MSSKNKTDKHLSKSVKLALDKRVSLKIPELSQNCLCIIGYSDSSFANNADLLSQLGYSCFLQEAEVSVIHIMFKCYMSSRVTRSAMAGGVIALYDVFDVAATLSAKIGMLFGQKIPVQLLLDIMNFSDVIS